MRRDPLGICVLLGLLGLAGGFAGITRAPDAAAVRTAASWPLVGPWIERLAERYRAAPATSLEDEETGVEILYEIVPGSYELRPRVWVPQDSALFQVPDAGTTPLATTEAASNLPVLERRGSWYRVGYRNLEAWVELFPQPAAGSEPPLGSAPSPPLPVPARPADPDLLAAARRLLDPAARATGTAGTVTALGPYALVADVRDAELLAYLDRVVGQVEPAYAAGYGVEPIGHPAETIVLFAGYESYARFQEANDGISRPDAPGFAHAGIVASYVQDRTAAEVAATLVHELVHLLNRRALGPALPAWLEEGLADDLGQARIGATGVLEADRLGGAYRRRLDSIEWRGGRAAAIQLRRALDREELPSLSDLVGSEWSADGDERARSLRYAQASFWIRSLLDGSQPDLGRGLRRFLAGVAAGGPADGEALRNALDRDWQALDGWLAAYVRVQVVE